MGRILWRAGGGGGGVPRPQQDSAPKGTALTYPEREAVRAVRKKEKLKMSLGANFKNMKQLLLRGHTLPETPYSSPPVTLNILIHPYFITPLAPHLRATRATRLERFLHAGAVLGADRGLRKGVGAPEVRRAARGPAARIQVLPGHSPACALDQVTPSCVWRGRRIKWVVSRRRQDSSPMHGMNLINATCSDGRGHGGGGGDGPIRQRDQ